jgi:hypothetical protein
MPKQTKLTNRKLDALIKDEREASKEYMKLGLPNLAKDESKHLKFLQSEKKRRMS